MLGFHSIIIKGRKITSTWWGGGISWYKIIELYADYANSIQKKCINARRQSVIELDIKKKGRVRAIGQETTL